VAANKIKGLTVEIGGDTTKLGKALESVNKKSSDLSSELGEINKLLKFDPGNADLLAQKQKVLSEAVENTAQKLKTLKEAEKQVQQQFERGEVSEDQVRALQREIVTTERKLDGYEKAAKETADAVDKLGDESKNVKGETKDVEKATDKAAKELDDYADKAKKADKASGKLGDTLKSGLKAGLAGIATAAGAAAAGMGKASVDAAAYADEVLTMSTVTGISTDKLQEYKYASELVDVSVETLTKSHAKNIKSMKAAQDGTKLAVDAYQKLGVAVTNSDGSLRDGETVYWEVIDALGKMENETERDALAMQILGKSAQELNPMIEAGSEKMKELSQEAHDVGAVMSEDALAALGSFDDSIQRLKGSAGAAKNSLGTVLVPELQMMTDAGTELLTDFTQKLNESGGGMDGFVSTVDSMAPEIASKISDLISQVLDKIVSLAPAIVKIGVGLVTNLVTSLISMLPQLVTTGIELILAVLNGLSSAIPQIVQAIAAMIPQLVQALVNGIPQLIQGAVQFILAILEAIPQVIPPLVAAIPQIVMTIINGLLTAIPQLIQGAVQFLLAIVQAIPVIIQALVPEIPGIITTIVDGLIDNIPVLLDGALQLLEAIVDAIPLICEALLPQLPKIVKTIIDKLVEMTPVLLKASITLLFALIDAIPVIVGELIKNLPYILKAIWEGLKGIPQLIGSLLSQALGKVGTWVSNMVGKARDMASRFISSVVNFFSQLPGKIWNWLSNAANKVVSWGSSLVAKGKAAVQKLVTAVVDKVKSIPDKMKSAGKNLVEGLWKGISGGYTWLKNKIKGWVGNVTNFIKKLFGIASPSKKTEWMGEMLDEGLAEGIKAAENSPLNAMHKLSEGMLDEADSLNGVTLERRLNHTFAPTPAAIQQGGMLDKLDKILAAIERGQVLTIDGKALIGHTVGDYDSAMGQRRALAARGAL
jgi:phage-related minor tail protein